MPSVSKNQQKFMGMVHGVQKGEVDPKDVSKDVRDTAKTMKKKDAKDFASTKHKGLPTKVENVDELFEQVFKESGFPDRMTPTDSFTEPDEDLIDFNKDRNERIKKEIVKRLKEANLLEFPQNWMAGRSVTNQHTAKKTAPRTYDNDEANFIVKNSGQPDLESDLEEHHEDYPDDILKSSVGDFLTKVKEKDEELYHEFENILDNYLGGQSSVNEDNGDYVAKHGKTDIQLKRGYKHLSGDELDKLYDEIGKFIEKKKLPVKRATLQFESKLSESAMGEISLIAQEAPNFKKFLQDVFKEFKDLEKTKEAIAWLKSVYDDRTNESVVDESIAININTLPDLIPSGEFKNRDLKQDIVDALNGIYKKYGIGRTIKSR